MEPLAPGTEDEKVDFNAITKQETEKSRLLKLRVFRNGRSENVFELSYMGGSEHWFCKVCECPVMGRVFQHEIGRRHSQNMSIATNYRENEGRENIRAQETVEEPINSLEVAPGEPVPPGFEGEFSRQAQIQERLDGFKVGPLVALEYLIEMDDFDPLKEPTYLCILCDKKGDPRTVLTHLASYNHISQYLQKHFPTCYRALAPYMTRQYKRNWQAALQRIAEAIERRFGRLKPFCISQDKFEKERMLYLSMISKGKHFSEQNGPTFIELIVHEELTKSYDDEGRPVKPSTSFESKPFVDRKVVIPERSKRSPSPPVVAKPVKKTRAHERPAKKDVEDRRRRSLSSVSSISSDEEFSKEGRRFARNRSPPSREFGRRADYRDNRHRSPSPRRKREEEEGKRRNREKERVQKLEEFSKLSKAIENDIEKSIKLYEKNPEKHPKYNDEWKLFWNKRYKELQTEGKDVSKYDFKPEWIDFWGKRMKELLNEELKNRKDGLRRRLGLPEEPAPISFRIGPISKNAKPKEVQKNVPMAAQPDNDPEIILLDDSEDMPQPKKAPTNRDGSRSPWESDGSPPKSVRSRSRSPLSDKRRGGSSSLRSRERSFDGKRGSEKRKSPSRARRSADRQRRSRSRDASRKSRDRYSRRSPLRRSRSPGPFRGDKGYSRDRTQKERSWERESSFERDIRSKERIRTVADLPWEREKLPSRMPDDFYGLSGLKRDSSRGKHFMPPPLMDDEPDDDDGEVNIVVVLRLLTALEERLGSLGPKIIDLLAQALAMEKKEANSSETLLDNEINCVMFETVKEKLKGQLLAGLVDPVQSRAFKKSIQKTASLLHIASERKKAKAEPEKEAVAVPGVGAVDKAAIARQLANALIAEGKTDVTEAELEQLVNAVVGIREASKASNKQISTADFLSQFAGESSGKQKTDLGSDAKEKIIIPRVRQNEEKRKDTLSELDSFMEPLSPGTPEKSASGNMENLSDSDLQTLLQNFKDLSTEEQMNLINYLKKLELDEPDRVERLRKFVNLGNEKPKVIIDLDKDRSARKSPFSLRMEEANKDSDLKREEKVVKIHLDSEEEDYSFEDVVKAASKNIKQKELEENRKIIEDSLVFSSEQRETGIKSNLIDAKTLISNLMGSLNHNKTGVSSSVNLLGLPVATVTTAPSHTLSVPVTPSPSTDFARALSGINLDNLSSIVNNVQKATSSQHQIQTPTSLPVSSNNNAAPRVRILSNTELRGPLRFESPRNVAQMTPRGSVGLRPPPMSLRPPPQQQSQFSQRGPAMNQFGNFANQRAQPPRMQFNPNYNPRFGGNSNSRPGVNRW